LETTAYFISDAINESSYEATIGVFVVKSGTKKSLNEGEIATNLIAGLIFRYLMKKLCSHFKIIFSEFTALSSETDFSYFSVLRKSLRF
jgi:hypothetical protein